MKPLVKNNIKDNYSKIQQVVEQMNENLQQAFSKQEEVILNFYKDEMYNT